MIAHFREDDIPHPDLLQEIQNRVFEIAPLVRHHRIFVLRISIKGVHGHEVENIFLGFHAVRDVTEDFIHRGHFQNQDAPGLEDAPPFPKQWFGFPLIKMLQDVNRRHRIGRIALDGQLPEIGF